MTEPPDVPPIILVVVPLPGDVPARVRVRKLLKKALRSWGLKVIDYKAATPAELAELAKILGRGEG